MKFRNFLLISIIAALFATCDNDGDSLDVGDVFSDNQAVMGYVDSFSLKLSTVRLDSFVTSGYSDLFLGYYKDDKIGNVLTEVYTPIVYTSMVTLPEGTIYDSLVVCFKPNGKWVGDTLQHKKVSIYRVLQTIEPDYDADQQKMFNHQKILRDTTPLATIALKPSPMQKLVSTARMSDELGKEWFSMIMESADAMSRTDYFMDYFKGIALVPDSTDFTWGMGFTGQGSMPSSNQVEDATQFEIRLYYRKPTDGEDDSYMTFTMEYDAASSYKYTYLNSNRTGTPFENLKNYDDKVLSSQSGSTACIQTGSGLALRIDFPSLNNLHSVSQYMNIVDARLIIKPQENSFDNEVYQLPSVLYVGVTDKSNKILTYLTDIMGSASSSTVLYEDETRLSPYYSFSLVRFIRSRILSPSEDFESIIIVPSEEEMATSFKRLIVDDYTTFGENVQLQIFYMTY